MFCHFALKFLTHFYHWKWLALEVQMHLSYANSPAAASVCVRGCKVPRFLLCIRLQTASKCRCLYLGLQWACSWLTHLQLQDIPSGCPAPVKKTSQRIFLEPLAQLHSQRSLLPLMSLALSVLPVGNSSASSGSLGARRR